MSKDSTRSSLELLFNVSRELARSPDLPAVLPRVLTLSVKNVDAERGTLIVLGMDEKPVDAAIVVEGQLISHTSSQLQATLDQGLAGWVLRQQKPALLMDTSKDERWLRRADDDLLRTGPKSAICIPVKSGEQLVGILTIVHSTPNFFNSDHLALLQAIADQAGIAISNALLYNSLQSATRRYRELFEENINPLIVTTWSGEILEANRAAASASGYALSDLTGRSIEMLEPSSPKKIKEETDALRVGANISYVSELHGKDGKNYPAEIFLVSARIGGQECLQWTLRDITERRELDHLREDLSAMIYHDLRSPLSNIISSLDMLKMLIPFDKNPNILPVFQISERSTERMQRLIESLLDINYLEAGQPITNKRETNIREMVYDAVEVIAPTAESKKQKVGIQLPDSLPAPVMDSDMIRRVLINLLENAVKYTPVEGELSTGVSHDGAWITIWVQDSGLGIPPEDQQRIFEKFTRLQSARFPKGLGLGLAFCSLAVRAHGGRIWVESKEGAGSRFFFRLPIKST
ncbi:MAG: GAF domain-containing protein [Anaerolineaceae bacterium]|nr:GAF domain-containing protein [Anaerolineaceae bacterium]